MLINGYNLSTEITCFLLTCLIIFLMCFTKPRKTRIYVYDFIGCFISILIILTECFIVLQTKNLSDFQPIVFNSLCLVYYLLYDGILVVIFMYVTQLGYDRYDVKKISVRIAVSLYVIFGMTATYLCLNDYMYSVTPQGSVVIADAFRIYLIYGMITTAGVVVFGHVCRKKITVVSYVFINIFACVEITVFVLQALQPEVFVSAITYVLPLTLFYVLFHSNPYDENSGCQNVHSFETRFLENVRRHRKYMIAYVSVSSIYMETDILSNEDVQFTMAESCRKFEKLYRKIHLYKITDFTYSAFINIKERDNAEEIFNELQTVLDEIVAGHSGWNIQYKLIGFQNHTCLKNMIRVNSMVNFLMNKMKSDQNCAGYFCKEEDYEAFEEQYNVYKMLMDIRHKKNLDDERVLCYAQPIYDIKTGGFRIAESLMRLSLNGKIIYPNDFIPLAEQHNCIHMLTCIMLNKVCKNIGKLQKHYDLEAITINCSSSEFSDRNLHKDILQIIEYNNIDASKIRIELTESVVMHDYETVLYNMNRLKEAGIQFFLDDFGTGYSNLERIVSYPFNTIKFDKSLLYKAVENESLSALVTSMIQVFKRQELVLLIEGVEDEQHRDYSIESGFDYIQGYHYAKPVPVEQLSEYFGANNN